jgi:hypothetical protein
MATAAPAPVIDVKAMAKGIGTIKKSASYSRIVVGKKTLAYVKRGTVTVRADLVRRAPKKLGRFSVESNGRWAGVAVADTTAARAVLEYAASRRGEAP